MSRITTFVGDFPTVAAVPPPAPDPIPPAPGDPAPTYPDYVVAPGSIVQETSIPDEGTAVGTLTISPSYSMRQSYEYAGSTTFRPEQGNRTVYTQTRSSRSGYRLVFNGLTTTEKSTLMTFFDDHHTPGGVVPFNWTPPGGSAGVYRLHSPAVPAAKRGGAVWNVVADLVELR